VRNWENLKGSGRGILKRNGHSIFYMDYENSRTGFTQDCQTSRPGLKPGNLEYEAKRCEDLTSRTSHSALTLLATDCSDFYRKHNLRALISTVLYLIILYCKCSLQLSPNSPTSFLHQIHLKFFSFLGARNEYLLRVFPFVCPHGTTRLPLDGFSLNLISKNFFINLSRKLEFH